MEGEDAAVGGDEPVAAGGRIGRHADDRLVEGDTAGGSVERGGPEAEYAAVTGDQPVAVSVGGGGHSDDRLVEMVAARRAVKWGVEREHSAVGGDQPVAAGGRIGRYAHVIVLVKELPPSDPWKAAPGPKLDTAPSEATNQYPASLTVFDAARCAGASRRPSTSERGSVDRADSAAPAAPAANNASGSKSLFYLPHTPAVIVSAESLTNPPNADH